MVSGVCSVCLGQFMACVLYGVGSVYRACSACLESSVAADGLKREVCAVAMMGAG